MLMTKTLSINHILSTCYQAIAAFEGPNPSNIILLHAEKSESLISTEKQTPFTKEEEIKPCTWLPPF